MSMSMLPAADSEVMYFFPVVFVAGSVNNGPVTACALLAGHPVGTCWIGCQKAFLSPFLWEEYDPGKITKLQTSNLLHKSQEGEAINLEVMAIHGGCCLRF